MDRKRQKTRYPGVYYRLNSRGERRYEFSYRGTDGKQRFETVAGGEKAAVEARNRVLDRMAHGHKVAPTKVTVEEYATRWLEEQHRPEKTMEAYVWGVGHIVRLLGKKKISDVDVHSVAWYISELKREGKKAWSIRNSLTPLRHILRQAVRDGQLPSNPMDQLERHERPQGDQRKMEILDTDEIQLLLSKATETYRPLLAMAVFTGMRIGELLALRWEDVDWDEGVIHVHKSKTLAGVREVVLMPALQQVLAQHSLKKEGEFVFETWQGNQMKRRTVSRRALEDTLTRAGITKHITFHELRHTYASILIDQGHPETFIAEQMGHSSADITRKIYGHLFDRKRRREDARAKLEASFGGLLGSTDGQHEVAAEVSD